MFFKRDIIPYSPFKEYLVFELLLLQMVAGLIGVHGLNVAPHVAGGLSPGQGNAQILHRHRLDGTVMVMLQIYRHATQTLVVSKIF